MMKVKQIDTQKAKDREENPASKAKHFQKPKGSGGCPSGHNEGILNGCQKTTFVCEW